MSIISSATNLSSILKKGSTEEREKSKTILINKVRFEVQKISDFATVVQDVLKDRYELHNNFVAFLMNGNIKDSDLHCIISEARKSIHLLKPKLFTEVVQALLSVEWTNRNEEIIQEFEDFYVTLIVVHGDYMELAISQLISYWIPNEKDANLWQNSRIKLDTTLEKRLSIMHKLIDKILSVIPLSFDVVFNNIVKNFPYYKKPAYVIGGYVHNILWLLEYQPIFTECIFQFLLKKLVHLDVNAPREEIEELSDDEDDNDDGKIFEMETCNEKESDTMSHDVAETLDICMEKLFIYLEKFKNGNGSKSSNLVDTAKFFKIFLNSFNNVILSSHNTHHVQFLMFYFCSFKPFLGEKFLENLWKKVINPNEPPPIRQASIGYIASFLARSKYTSLNLLRSYLSEMCNWAHQYIERSDSFRSNSSLKANIVFYSTCQAIFYIIAFRSKDLTRDKKGLLFLQSLFLSTLVTSNFNPLKYCLPAVATTFAGVTRTYQLAYCHTILERNARKKLATIYSNEIIMPDEYLDTFFPFDPYLLKKSGKKISPIYLKYQASEAEEDGNTVVDPEDHLQRKRECETNSDDIDDFIIDKRRRLNSGSSYDKELQFNYGLSPGFQL